MSSKVQLYDSHRQQNIKHISDLNKKCKTLLKTQVDLCLLSLSASVIITIIGIASIFWPRLKLKISFKGTSISTEVSMSLIWNHCPNSHFIGLNQFWNSNNITKMNYENLFCYLTLKQYLSKQMYMRDHPSMLLPQYILLELGGTLINLSYYCLLLLIQNFIHQHVIWPEVSSFGLQQQLICWSLSSILMIHDSEW